MKTLLLWLLLSLCVHGAEITLEWDAPKGGDPVREYVLYEVAFNRTKELTRTIRQKQKLSVLRGTYVFVVTCVTIYGEESDPSDPVLYTAKR